MKNLLRLIRTIMLTHMTIRPQASHTTLPSWLKDFNGPVCIENWNPDEDYCNMFRLPVVLVKFTRSVQMSENV